MSERGGAPPRPGGMPPGMQGKKFFQFHYCKFNTQDEIWKVILLTEVHIYDGY